MAVLENAVGIMSEPDIKSYQRDIEAYWRTRRREELKLRVIYRIVAACLAGLVIGAVLYKTGVQISGAWVALPVLLMFLAMAMAAVIARPRCSTCAKTMRRTLVQSWSGKDREVWFVCHRCRRMVDTGAMVE